MHMFITYITFKRLNKVRILEIKIERKPLEWNWVGLMLMLLFLGFWVFFCFFLLLLFFRYFCSLLIKTLEGLWRQISWIIIRNSKSLCFKSSMTVCFVLSYGSFCLLWWRNKEHMSSFLQKYSCNYYKLF